MKGCVTIDQIDKKIIKLLKEDSKQKYKTIGEAIHMTGQAVGNRVRKLEDDGIIKAYTIKVDAKKQGLIMAYVTLFMNGNDHYRLKQFVEAYEEITEAYRISGDACYYLKLEVSSHDRLNKICDQVLKFANYKVNIVVDTIKE